MRFLKKAHELIRQNEQIVKKSQKHDANLQKNSTLYFQIGLIMVLLTTYGLFEMEFVTSEILIPESIYIEDDDLVVQRDIQIYEEISAKIKKSNDPVIFKDPEIKKDDASGETLDVIVEPPSSDEPPIDPSSIKVIEIPEPDDIPYDYVERVPIYPGCEKITTNVERKKCMSEKISKLIRKKFNPDLADGLGLSGKQKIDVQFKIDKTGKVTDIKTRAPHARLEKEAERVINKIPQMTPGRQSNKNVGVICSLPIIFKVQY
jgi:protein TonB